MSAKLRLPDSSLRDPVGLPPHTQGPLPGLGLQVGRSVMAAGRAGRGAVMRVTGRRGFSPLRSHDFSAGHSALQNDLFPPQNRVNLWLSTEQKRGGRGSSLSILGPLALQEVAQNGIRGVLLGESGGQEGNRGGEALPPRQ